MRLMQKEKSIWERTSKIFGARNNQFGQRIIIKLLSQTEELNIKLKR